MMEFGPRSPLVQCFFLSLFCPNPAVATLCLLSGKHPTSPNMSSALWKWKQQPTHKSLLPPVSGTHIGCQQDDLDPHRLFVFITKYKIPGKDLSGISMSH